MPKNPLGSEHQSQAAETMLGLLDVVENGEITTQRNLARRLGVALGLTNSLIKRCVHKGLIKVSEAPARRYAYYLTPKGFQEKSRLTARYLSTSLDFFRTSRSEYLEISEYCKARGWSRVALHGASELAEIATLAGSEAGLKFVVIVDTGRNATRFCGIPVVQNLSDFDEGDKLDAVIVTDTINPQNVYNELIRTYPLDRVLTPSVLRVFKASEPSTKSDLEDGK